MMILGVFTPDFRLLGILGTLGGTRISGRRAYKVYRLVNWLASLGDCFRSNRVVTGCNTLLRNQLKPIRTYSQHLC